MEQQVRFCRTADGVNIAYASAGTGPPVVKVATFLTHVEHDWQSPVVRPFLDELRRGRQLVRYDARGCGLSDREVASFSLDAWVADLEAVVDAAGLERFALFAHCAPVGIAYAARHPERVSELVLLGGWARSVQQRRLDAARMEQMRLLVKLAGVGWGLETPAFRQVFTALMVPDSAPEQTASFTALQKLSSTPDCAARIFSAMGKVDVLPLCPQVRCPTFVAHARLDASVDLEEGRVVAGAIPQSRFLLLEGRNHFLLPHEPAWPRFFEALRSFLAPAAAARLGGLTGREAEVLDLVARGLDNAQIAVRLSLSEKTVRNRLSQLYAKLQVEGRAQAIVAARDAGLGH